MGLGFSFSHFRVAATGKRIRSRLSTASWTGDFQPPQIAVVLESDATLAAEQLRKIKVSTFVC